MGSNTDWYDISLGIFKWNIRLMYCTPFYFLPSALVFCKQTYSSLLGKALSTGAVPSEYEERVTARVDYLVKSSNILRFPPHHASLLLIFPPRCASLLLISWHLTRKTSRRPTRQTVGNITGYKKIFVLHLSVKEPPEKD